MEYYWLFSEVKSAKICGKRLILRQNKNTGMKHPDPIRTTDEAYFVVGESDFGFYRDRPRRCEGGAILYCCDGSADVSVDLSRRRVGPGTLVLLLPGAVLMIGDPEPGFRMRFCAFTAELFGILSYRLEPSFFRILGEHPFSDRAGEGGRGIEIWFDIAKYTYEDRDNMFRRTIVKNRLQNVFLEVYDKLQRRIGLRSEGVGDRRNELFHRFIHLLRSACTEQREVTWYADRLCVSTRYLASITHAVDRKSPKELIDEFVVLEIKMLLQSTDLTLQEIAARMHFPDQSCMGHYFRRRTGMSPLEWRRRR